MKKSIRMFFWSLLFAFSPIILAFFVSLIDSTPTKGGSMNAAEGVLVFAFITLPIGFIAAIVFAVRTITKYLKGETNN